MVGDIGQSAWKWFNIAGFSHILVSTAPLIVLLVIGRLVGDGIAENRPDLRRDGTSLAGLDA